MTATFEFWTRQLLVELLPIGQLPCVNLEVFNIMAQVWHMFSSKSFV